jgi:hypothetical protein
MSISWAESALAEAIAPAPARISRKKPRLLLMFPPSGRINGKMGFQAQPVMTDQYKQG